VQLIWIDERIYIPVGLKSRCWYCASTICRLHTGAFTGWYIKMEYMLNFGICSLFWFSIMFADHQSGDKQNRELIFVAV